MDNEGEIFFLLLLPDDEGTPADGYTPEGGLENCVDRKEEASIIDRLIVRQQKLFIFRLPSQRYLKRHSRLLPELHFGSSPSNLLNPGTHSDDGNVHLAHDDHLIDGDHWI